MRCCGVQDGRVAETLAMEEDAGGTSGSGTRTSTGGRPVNQEAAFVIYSADQQRVRDAERKAKEEAEKAEVR